MLHSAMRRTGQLCVIAAACFLRSATGEVTFIKDIAPIVWKQCAPCHRPGQAAPFALVTYEEAKSKQRQIVKAISDNYMPPWPPEPGYGHFQNKRRLSGVEKKLIEEWVASGSAE